MFKPKKQRKTWEQKLVDRLVEFEARPSLCSCCGTVSSFRIHGFPPRLNARCSKCGSLERHRLVVLYLQRNPHLLASRDVLHFAPEDTIRKYVTGRAGRYTAGDLNPSDGDLRLNIEEIDLPDNSVDTIICSHILEHVDDRAALKELFRILRPGGTALLLFPLIEGWETTFEDPSIVAPEERLRFFGQEDHVRFFGRDARDRIRNAGFKLSEFTAVEPDVQEYGLRRGEKIFVSEKL